MLPAAQLPLHADTPAKPFGARLSSGRAGACRARLRPGIPVLAQEDESVPVIAPVAEETREVAFESNEIEYNYDQEIVTASGNVILRSEGQSVRADRVVWDRNANLITASGNIRFLDRDGNLLYTDSLTLTDDMKIAAMKNLLLALREGGRLAANSGERSADGTIVLDHAAYSACAVEDDEAAQAAELANRRRAGDLRSRPEAGPFQGRHARTVRHAAVPLPHLSVATDGRAISGLTVPNIRYSPRTGLNSARAITGGSRQPGPVGHRLCLCRGAADDLGPVSFSHRQWRLPAHRLCHRSQRVSIAPSPGSPQNDWRGYFFATADSSFRPNGA